MVQRVVIPKGHASLLLEMGANAARSVSSSLQVRVATVGYRGEGRMRGWQPFLPSQFVISRRSGLSARGDSCRRLTLR